MALDFPWAANLGVSGIFPSTTSLIGTGSDTHPALISPNVLAQRALASSCSWYFFARSTTSLFLDGIPFFHSSNVAVMPRARSVSTFESGIVPTIGMPKARSLAKLTSGYPTVQEIRWINGKLTLRAGDPVGRRSYQGSLKRSRDLEISSSSSTAWQRCRITAVACAVHLCAINLARSGRASSSADLKGSIFSASVTCSPGVEAHPVTSGGRALPSGCDWAAAESINPPRWRPLDGFQTSGGAPSLKIYSHRVTKKRRI